MPFTLKSWTGENVTPRRLAALNRVNANLKKTATPYERLFRKAIGGFCNNRSPLWFTEQKVFHVHAEQAFVVDFCFQKCKVIVEIDGKHHMYGLKKVEDGWRDHILESRGWRVLRFQNDLVESDKWCVVREVIEQCRNCRLVRSKIDKQLRRVKKNRPRLYELAFAD